MFVWGVCGFVFNVQDGLDLAKEEKLSFWFQSLHRESAWSQWRSTEGIRSPGTTGTDGCELL